MFDALLYPDKDEKDEYSLVGSISGSNLIFPIVTRAIKTGSRVERVYLNHSDVDFMYEIGPYKVTPDPILKFCHKLSCVKIHAGYYHIYDNKNKPLYPKALQVKVAPMIKGGKEGTVPVVQPWTFNQYEKSDVKEISVNPTKAALPNRFDDDDEVIAFALSKWPKDVIDSFSNDKLLWCKDVTVQGKLCKIFFVFYVVYIAKARQQCLK